MINTPFFIILTAIFSVFATLLGVTLWFFLAVLSDRTLEPEGWQ